MNRKVFIIITIMTMSTFINNFAHPVTPALVEHIGYGSFLYGALFASMSIANFLMSPVWGRLSDRFGRKIFMILAPIGYGLAQLGFGYSTSPAMIIFFRLLAGGIACASFVAGMAYLIDVSDVSKRTKLMTIYTAITGFAATLGYLVGGYIGNEDYHKTFLAQGILSIASSLIIILFIKESRHKVEVKRSSNFLQDFSKYFGSGVPFLLFITLLTSFIAIGFNTGFNSYMKYILHLESKQLGLIMAITGFIGLIMNIVIFPFIKKKFNDYYSLVISIFLMAVSLGLATLFEKNEFHLTLIILVIFFAFLGLYRPLIQSILSKLGHGNGEIMGLNNAFSALGNVGGSLYIGAIFDVSIGITFYSLSLISFIVFILLLSRNNQFKELG